MFGYPVSGSCESNQEDYAAEGQFNCHCQHGRKGKVNSQGKLLTGSQLLALTNMMNLNCKKSHGIILQ